MFKQVKLTTAAVLMTLVGFSAQSQAAESGLERLVDGAVKQAVYVTAQELNFDVLTAVATLTHHVAFDDENFNTQVLISNVDDSGESEMVNDNEAE